MDKSAAAAVDGAPIDDSQDGFDLLVFEVLHAAATGTLERHGEDALTVCESCGVLHGAVPEERVDRGEAHIAGGDAVAPVVLQVLKKREDRLWPEVVQVQPDDGLLRLRCDEAQQQHQAVPIAPDGCGDSCLAPGAGDRRRTPGGLGAGCSGRWRSSRTSRTDGRRRRRPQNPQASSSLLSYTRSRERLR